MLVVPKRVDAAVAEQREGVLVAARRRDDVPGMRIVADRQQDARRQFLRARGARAEAAAVAKAPRVEPRDDDARARAGRLPGHGERVVQAARDVPDESPAPLEELDGRRSRRKVGVVLLWNRGLARLALDRLVVVLAGALAQLPAAVVAPNVKRARRLAGRRDDDRRVRAAGRDADDPAVGQALDALRRSLAAAVAVPEPPARARAPGEHRPVGERDDCVARAAGDEPRSPQAAERLLDDGARRVAAGTVPEDRAAAPADEAPVGRDRDRGALRRGDGAQEVARGVHFAAAVLVEVEAREPRHVRRPAVPRSRRRIGDVADAAREEPRGRLARRRRRRLHGAARLARPGHGRRQRLLSPVEPSQFAVEVERPVVGLRGRRRPRPPAAGPRGRRRRDVVVMRPASPERRRPQLAAAEGNAPRRRRRRRDGRRAQGPRRRALAQVQVGQELELLH